MAVAALIAALLRFWHLDLQSLSHPEIYAPGIDLVPGISEPPPRHGFMETLNWHFHDEPHPIGYYLAMFGWTELFGTSVFALRAPDAILGVLSVVAIGLLATRIFGRTVGVLSALMLAGHGFHVFWSQISRMYVPGAFLGLVSVMILVEIVRAPRPRPALEAAYVLVTLAGIETTEFFWPLLFVQMSFAILVATQDMEFAPPGTSWKTLWRGFRLGQIQALVTMLGAPELAHAVYRARRDAAPPPNISFLQEYFSFGFLFSKNEDALPALAPAPLLAALALVLGLALLAIALRAHPRIQIPGVAKTPIPPWLHTLTFTGTTAGMVWLAMIAHRRNGVMLALSVLPLLSLALPFAMAVVARWLRNLPGVTVLNPASFFLFSLAVLPPIAFYIMASKVSMLAPRAFLIFIPYLLILIAASICILPKPTRPILTALLAGLFAYSIHFASLKPPSPNDYKTLAQLMAREMMPGDLIFVRNRNWVDTPLFYYLPNKRYVAENYSAALSQMPDRRIWLVWWPFNGKPALADARTNALRNYRLEKSLHATRAQADLFLPQ